MLACSKPAPPPVAPPAVLGEGPEVEAPTPLDGPFQSLDEAPAPHGASRSSLLDARPGGPFLEATLLAFRDTSGAIPTRCAVALRLDRGWYVGTSFACEHQDEKSAMGIEALAIELVDASAPPQARIWYLERRQHDDPAVKGDESDDQRTMVVVCTAPTAAAPACAAPVERVRER
jgi:hypothetical protein